jgi:hypothetical protein
MKKCKLCGIETEFIYNIKLKAVSLCQECARSIAIQEVVDSLTNNE